MAYIPTDELIFSDVYTGSGILNFGYAPSGQLTLDVTVSPTFSPTIVGELTFVAPAIPPVALTMNASIAVDFSVTSISGLNFKSNIWRGITSRAACVYSLGNYLQTPHRIGWSKPIATDKECRPLSVDGSPLQSHLLTIFNSATDSKISEILAVTSIDGKSVAQSRTSPWVNPQHISNTLRLLANRPLTVANQSIASYWHLQAIPKRVGVIWVDGGNVGKQVTLTNSADLFVAKALGIVHTHGQPLYPGASVIPTWIVPGGPHPPYTRSGILRFACRLDDSGHSSGVLRFREPQCDYLTIPIKRTYLVSNSFSLVRADNGTPLYATSFDLSVDSGSWTWSWSAKVHGRQISDVLSMDVLSPVEVLATLNGTLFHLVIEKVTRDRSFTSDTISLSGRGLAAYLDTPYAPISTNFSNSIITAQQAANTILEINNVPIGWDIDWQVTDWPIAGSAWSSTGTYIAQLQTLATSAGGYLQPTTQNQTMRILPYYAVAPWDWPSVVPDLILPDAVVSTEGIEYTNKTNYTGVYVYGGSSGGVLDFVKRAGTDGTLLAATIVDPLATNSDMTRQRGLRVLGDTGIQASVSLKLPIMPQTGIILPGTMVRYVIGSTAKIGVVRSVSVTYSMPTAWQTIKVETHESI